MATLAATARRVVPPLATAILVGCSMGHGAEPTRAAPQPLPFTYPPNRDGGRQGGRDGGVRAILEDREGNRWFGSHSEGVCRIDRAGITHFTEADGLSDGQVRSIQEAPDGGIWFDCGLGISRFDGTRISSHPHREWSMAAPWALEPDDLWFKSNESHGFSAEEREAGVYRLHEGTLTYLPLPLPPPLRTDSGYSVTGFAKGKGGRIWIATYNAVFGFDGASFTIIDGARMGLRPGEGVPHVRAVFEDRRGRVWIGNNGVGVVVVDGDATYGLAPPVGDGEALLRMGSPLTPSAAANHDASLQRVFSFGEDRDGNVWIGTIGGGAWRYDGRDLRQFTSKDGLTTADVMTMYRDRDGTLWLGGIGVFRFTGTRFERVH